MLAENLLQYTNNIILLWYTSVCLELAKLYKQEGLLVLAENLFHFINNWLNCTNTIISEGLLVLAENLFHFTNNMIMDLLLILPKI